MDEKGKDTIAAFDRLLTTNRIQMMKVFLSYLAPEQQGGLAVYIKLSELKYAMEFTRRYPGRPLFREQRTILSVNSLLDGSLLEKDQEGVLELLDELLPFSNPKERARIQGLKNLLTSFSRMREMMAMMEMMKELFPEGMGGEGGLGEMFSGMAGAENMTGMPGMGDMASALGGVDPSALFQMMQMLQPTPPAAADKPEDKADDTSEHMSNGKSDNISSGTSDGIANDLLYGIADGLPNDMADSISDGLSNDIADSSISDSSSSGKSGNT